MDEWIKILNAIVVLIGIPTIVKVLVDTGKKLEKIDSVSKTIEGEISPGLKDVRERFMVVEDRVESLWKDKLAPAQSPRQLNERGENVLNESGIKSIVDKNKEKLLGLVRQKDVTNAYDAERAISEVMMDLPKHCPEIVDDLKNGAFRVGADVDAVLFVGSIYLRNLIFSELGFNLKDLDGSNELPA